MGPYSHVAVQLISFAFYDFRCFPVTNQIALWF